MSDAPQSVFATDYHSVLQRLYEEIRSLYLRRDSTWVIAYSGGKDSTATLQLIWNALSDLDPAELSRPIEVVAVDTGVENPVVRGWLNNALLQVQESAELQGLPLNTHLVRPHLDDSFWVNLIGRGYPAPGPRFRWCTDRLKIRPMESFLRDHTAGRHEVILVLGSRRSESAARAQTLSRRDHLLQERALRLYDRTPGTLLYTPIEPWTTDDVWLYLLQEPSPFGLDNELLLDLYRGASPDQECPVVADTATPSCGKSRFGCWVCTVVDEDRSMGAMVRNQPEYGWMRPLLELRDELAENHSELREVSQQAGRARLYRGRAARGPYSSKGRAHWLRRVLQTQTRLEQQHGSPAEPAPLISLAELEEIRRIWSIEKHELEDRLPIIWEEETGEVYPGKPVDDRIPFDRDELELLRESWHEQDAECFDLACALLEVERQYQTMVRRAGLFEALDQTIREYFRDDDQLVERAERESRAMNAAGAYGADDSTQDSTRS